MNLQTIIESVGLNEKEAKVYLASLCLGLDTAANIARKSSLKRTTVYFVLNELVRKGLASIRQTGATTLFSVLDPEKLANRFREQEKKFDEALPELKKIKQADAGRPKIEVFEGKNGVKNVYSEVKKYLSKPGGVLAYGSLRHLSGGEYRDLLEEYAVLLKDKRNFVKELLENGEEVDNYIEEISADKNSNHEIRFLPRGYSYFGNDNVIYGNKLAIFSFQKELFVVVIESKNIADSYRNLFMLAWKSAKSRKSTK